MKTLLVFGASITHGIGGEQGGWVDKLKNWLHQEMADVHGAGLQCAVYELGVIGNTTRDIVGRFEVETLARIEQKDPKNTYILFSAGTNDSKASSKPDNYLYTPDEFATNAQAFIRLAKEYANHVWCVGLVPVDQAKVHPKRNPLTGGTSYFENQRIHRFEEALALACKTEKIPCITLFDTAPTDWTKQYLTADGMHPNDAGHQWIFEQVRPKLRTIVGPKK
ncbi:MAG TPA: GDSL-type esterase/lipase family protein [Candidatus Saccharimonadales bacterium]|nr:GDSL-type esterase/lipase family protein [Candidatus Saccharimonadales bacterium]